MRRVLSIAMAVSLGILLALGVAFAIQRGLSVASADPGALDREQLEGIAAMTGLTPESPEYIRLARELPRAAANLNARPAATLGHVVPGALFFVLVGIQFSRRLRARHPALHRWNGRAMLVLAAACGIAGIYLGLAEPYGGVMESAATTLFGGLFLFCAWRGYTAIRRRAIAQHREWMIRFFALGIAISVIRLVGMANASLVGTEAINPNGFAISLWVGWLITLGAAELWIRRTRASRPIASLHDLQPQ